MRIRKCTLNRKLRGVVYARAHTGSCFTHTKQKIQNSEFSHPTKISINKSYVLFKDLFLLLFFLLERRIYREERQRGRSSVRSFTPQVSARGRYYADPKPGASSGSPTRVQGPKALGRPRLLSQATGRELEGKRGCRRPHGIPGVQGEDL